MGLTGGTGLVAASAGSETSCGQKQSDKERILSGDPSANLRRIRPPLGVLESTTGSHRIPHGAAASADIRSLQTGVPHHGSVPKARVLHQTNLGSGASKPRTEHE